MIQVIISPKAKSDLSDIWEYTLAEWGIVQAENYVRELWAVILEKGCDLSTSTDVSDVRKGYRRIRSGPHINFFKQTCEGIDVIRILHQRMDFECHL
jgi:toxin ParE1/3/4